MGSLRTTKVGEDFYDVFTVFDFDLISTVSGLAPGTFTVTFALNATEVPGFAYTIVEIGTTGNYALVVAGGFPTVGLWTVNVFIGYNESTWQSHVEVREHDIDDVYDAIVGGGIGLESVTLTLQDSANGNVPVPDLLINVYDSTNTVFITFGRTDVSGNLQLSIDPGTYTLRMFKPAYSTPDQSLVVADTGGVTPQAFTLFVESIIISPPPSPDLCRLYGDFVKLDGTPLVAFVVQVKNLYDPTAASGLNTLEGFQQYTTDASGHVEFDIVRETRIRIAFVGTSFSRDITVPDLPVQNLTTVFGQATDNFTVVVP